MTMKKEPGGESTRNVAVIVPAYNEETTLQECRRALADVFSSMPDVSFSVLFVDDGSTDGTWEKLAGLNAADERFRALRLSRNFGPHAAIAAGFDRARADAYVVISCDLQDPPEKIPEMISRWKAGAELVFGRRRLASDGFPRSLMNRIFYSILNKHGVPPGTKFATESFYLVDEAAAKVFRKMTERNRMTFPLLAHAGFRQETIGYERRPRAAGETGWRPARLRRAFLDAVVGYTRLPARIMFAASLLTFAASVASAIPAFERMFSSRGFSEWLLVVSVLCFLFSLQFSFMGLTALYLGRIYSEAAGRPLFVVRETIGDVEPPEE